jgi:hypothetical protein
LATEIELPEGNWRSVDQGLVWVTASASAAPSYPIVPPPVYEHCRAEIRAAPLVHAKRNLESHEGTTNVVVFTVVKRDPADGPQKSYIEGINSLSQFRLFTHWTLSPR